MKRSVVVVGHALLLAAALSTSATATAVAAAAAAATSGSSPVAGPEATLSGNLPHGIPVVGSAAGTPTSTGIVEPDFAEPIMNQTVSTGRRVTLSCVVDNLGSYRVAWLYVEKYTLLTLSKAVITHNNRFRVTHNGHRTWNLVISDVQEKDKGAYMCQINTSPMKYQLGYLDVVVPPTIREDDTSSDTEVKEGGDVSLYCAARGTPEPNVQWRREDEQDIQLDQYKTNVVKGPWLNISKVSRLHMAPYLCIASNNVPPSVSKRIKLDVQFAPMVWITDQLLGQSVGSSVRLSCNLECHPRGLAYWTRNGEILRNGSSGGRFVEEVHQLGAYKHVMVLEVHNLSPDDFGEYHCVAKNPLGETEGTIKVYEVPALRTTTTPRPEPPRELFKPTRSRPKSRNSPPKERTRKPVFNTELITNEIFPPNDRVLSGYNVSSGTRCCLSDCVVLLAAVLHVVAAVNIAAAGDGGCSSQPRRRGRRRQQLWFAL